MNKLKSGILFLLAGILLYSCSGGKTDFNIPKDAGVIFVVDVESLSGKLSWDEILQTDYMKDGIAEIKDSVAKGLIQNPGTSGIDVKKGFIFFTAKKGGTSYGSVQGALADEAAFEKFITKIDEQKTTPQKSGDFKYIANNDGILSWTGKKFIAVFAIPDNMARSFNGLSGDFDGGQKEVSTDTLKEIVSSLYSLKNKNSINSEKTFTSLIKEKGDFKVWANSGNIYGSMAMGAMMGMLKVNDLIKDNISVGVMNFDNGKITANGKQIYNDELAKIYKEFKGAAPAKDLAARLPENDAIFAGVAYFPMKAIAEIVKLVGAEGIANSFLGKSGLTIDEIVKAFSGDIAFSLTDIVSKEKTMEPFAEGEKPYTYNKTEPQFVLGIGKNDAAIFKKILQLIGVGDIQAEAASNDVTVVDNDQWFVVSSLKLIADNFIKGGNKNSYTDKFSGHGMAMHLNFDKLFGAIETNSTTMDSTEITMLQQSKAFWQDLMVSTDYNKGDVSYKMDCNLKDNNANSLKQLNNYINQMYLQSKKYKRATVEGFEYKEEDIITDTALLPPPPPPAKSSRSGL